MSGPFVQVIGGPLDGQERRLISSQRMNEAYFEAGDWRSGSREMHVYRSWGGKMPYTYRGIRPWKGEPILPLIV